MSVWNFFARYKKPVAALLGLAVLVCAWGLTRLKPDENIHAMIPASVRERVELFEYSPLNKKVFIGVSAPSAEEASLAADTLRAELAQADLLALPPTPGADYAQTLYRALPYRFSADDEQTLLLRLTPEFVKKRMADNYENLLSFQGFLLKDFISLDPLNFTELMAQKLAAFGAGTALEYQDGFLSSKDGKTLIGPYDFPGQTADFKAAQRFADAFQQAAQKLGPSVHAFYLGALRYTVENVRMIQTDLIKISVLALLALAAVFIFFFRHKSALLIYLLPVFILPPAALITYAVFGHLSGITLGFGSVVAGLSVDYSVYVFFALRGAGNTPARETLFHMKKHLLCNFMTSSLCFLALFCSSVELFRQIAVFSVAGLALSLALALYVFPHYWTHLGEVKKPAYAFSVSPLSRRVAVWVSAGLILFGVLGVWRVQFSGNVEDLNASTPAFKKDKAVFDSVFAKTAQNNALLFVFGNSKESALENNESFPLPLAVSGVVPSDKLRAENVARWRSFWSASRANYARLLVSEEAQKIGLKPAGFAPFFESILNAPAPDTFDFTDLYNPLVSLPDGRSAVVNIVPNERRYREAAQQSGAVFVAADELKSDLIGAVGREALKIVLLAFLFNLAAVWLTFKKLKTALLTFIPVVLAAGFTFGCFWLLQVQVNLFILVFLPLLMGLGIDYGIFQVMKTQAGKPTAYPPSALLAAGLSTLAGFGVLIGANHGVLFIMGLSSFLGVGGAMLASLFILPAFLEQK